MNILNNTIYNVAKGPGLIVHVDQDAVIKNNLLFANNGGKLQASIQGENIVSDYNAYFGAWRFNMEGGHSFALTNEQTAKLTADAIRGHFMFSSRSPVIDKGTRLQGFQDDVAGEPRPKGRAWDIGAFEYDVLRSMSLTRKRK